MVINQVKVVKNSLQKINENLLQFYFRNSKKHYIFATTKNKVILVKKMT
ncbi:hypothetical protein SAMN05443633_1313 [Chryseobacterium arachidis]|uniref:Uncharacterized protein n=1 Tax=Chryseobacterium arachidis TaxID=1416778 RepID=A0A1M5N183_9FLAO|nr:hypothetical protein SAMN05443633_1313 [Chryseobacterium arachidis]